MSHAFPTQPARRARARWTAIAAIGALATLLAAIGAGRVRAELLEQARRLGPQLAGFAELTGTSTALELNGARLYLSTRVVPDTAASVLDGFEALCERGAPLIAAELREAQAGQPHGLPAFLGALRQDFDSGGGGVAVCLAETEPLGLRALLGRARELAHSGDLASLGQLRYAFVRRTARGESHVLLAWSEGPLPLFAMFPDSGDAAGGDLAGVPRPAGARRLLSAALPDGSYGLAAYALLAPPSAADASQLRARLAGAGFALLAHDGVPPGSELWRRAGESLLVQRLEPGAEPVLALLRMPAARGARPATAGAPRAREPNQEPDHVD